MPAPLLKHWWHKIKKLKPKQEKPGGQTESEKVKPKKKKQGKQEDSKPEYDPLQDQICYHEKLPEMSELAEDITALAERGGYLLVCLAKADQKDELKKRALEAALSCSPFVPIFEPYEGCKIEDKPLIVIPIPHLVEESSSYRFSHLNLTSTLRSTIAGTDSTVDIQDIRQLAIILAALANASGGLVFLRNDTCDRNDALLWGAINGANNKCRPAVSIEEREIYWDSGIQGCGWIIGVKHSPTQVHSVDKEVYQWENLNLKKLTIDESYKLIKSRCISDYPLILPLPVIAYAHLEWPYFDAREPYRIRYNPQKQIIKWVDHILAWQTHDYRFNLRLPLTINRPIELYNHRQLKGEIHLQLKEKLLSGLEVDYFNALGERRPQPQGGSPSIEKTSKVILKFEVMLDPIFRRRRFSTERKLEFEGMKITAERLRDIQTILATLGLQNIERKPAKEWLFDKYLPFNDETVEHVMKNGGYWIAGRKPGLLWLRLEITGQPVNIVRERAEGDRIDEILIQAGKTHITLRGWIKGESPHELFLLLNQLQQLLKERFDHVRFQVV